MTQQTQMKSDEKIIDSLANELMISENKSLTDRIGSNTVNLTNYQKHDGGSGTRVTGKALLANKISNLSVIDIDINESYTDELKETVRKNIMVKLSTDDVVVKTASGGLHIYCNTDLFFPTSNRNIKCYSCNDFDIDLMCSVDENSRSLIVAAGSKVRDSSHKGPIKTYEFMRGSYESVLTRNVNDVLNDLDIKLKIKQTPEVDAIITETEGVIVSNDLAEALVNGLCDLEIHNDAGSRPIKTELTLFTLFQAINSLPKQFIEEAYDNVYQLCKLTDKAKENFDKARSRYQHLLTSPFVLVKIMKLYQPEYYEEVITPLISVKANVFNIDLNDSFCITDIRKKAEQNLYKNNNEVIEDLSKVIRFVDIGNKMYIQKEYDIFSKMWKINFVTDKNMKDSLKMIHLWKDGAKTINAYDVLLTNITSLTVKGVEFNSSESDIFSVFHGYKYSVLEKFDYSVIEPFLNFVNEVICDNNDELYKYLLGWIASMIQNPGVKNETALILKGLQGIGKNRFTDVISELLAGYSCKNVTEISELTGNFNSIVENQMFIVLNELKNCGDDRMANFNSLKSIITDNTIRINEKNQPRRNSQNVANFIFVTNNAYPVKIETGDRRYVVFQCNGKYKGQFAYFKQFVESFNKEFYDNLLTYFVKYNLNGFEVRNIPMTEAKQDLIEASKSPIDVWICDHYNDLIEGVQCSEALLSKPSEMKDRAFQLQIKDKCVRNKRGPKGQRQWYYILKDECKSVYHQTVYEDNDDNEEI